MFDTRKRRYRFQVPGTRPASQTHLNNAHSQRLEVLIREIVVLAGGQFGETELDIAPYNRDPRPTDRKGKSTKKPADSERHAMRQQAHQAQ